MLAFIPGLPGGTEWIIILIIALLIFGKRLPEVMRSMGQSIKQFKRGMEEVDLNSETEREDNTSGKKQAGLPENSFQDEEDDEAGNDKGGKKQSPG